ncbi:hypothetical protein ABEB36_005980 [Hypothenemus hampei]|uniref:UDP-glucuronosyltransferase n=1 Tax=Hypothenemus hampei TaxID=57062 RepID=A0ABD1F025_HYPHA
MRLVTLLSVLCLCCVTNGARILGIFLTPSYSHQIVFQPIWKELSLRGHQVTVYTPSPLNDPSLTNLTEYDLGFSFPVFDRLVNVGADFSKLVEMYEEVTDIQLSHPIMQDLLKNADKDKYDLLLVEYLWPVYFAFKELYDVPMVGVSSFLLTSKSLDNLGMERHPVVEPDFLLGISTTKNFGQRLKSWLFRQYLLYVAPIRTARLANRQVQKYFNINKTISQLSREVSIVLGNYNYAQQNVKPTTPKFIPLSAIHVHPPKPLPQNLRDFLDSQPNDAIYFSLGTNVNMSLISHEQLNLTLNVLGSLPYTVLFKSDPAGVDDLPNNFYVQKWFPQQDVLAHPKIKLFITQGGIQSIDEAIDRGVPMLIIPFLGDQMYNADRSSQLGISEKIIFGEFKENELRHKINILLSDPLYRTNLKKLKDIVTDQPMRSVDTAMFWIEYVIRHKGASHLNYLATDLPFYQFYLLDVYVFMLLVCYLIFKIFKVVIRSFLSGKRKLKTS